MRTIAIMNQKGGSGKTTTAVNLAAAIGEKGRKVLVIDMDPQASASLWFGLRDAGKELLEVLTGPGSLADEIRPTGAPFVYMVPCSTWLASAERALSDVAKPELILRRKLSKLGEGWDYCIIDCPPMMGVLSISALAAATEVLVPVEARVLALAGLGQVLATIDVVRDTLNPGLTLGGILACRVDRRTTHCGEILEQLQARFPDQMYKTIIRENVRLSEAPSYAKPITLYDKASTGAKDYRDLAAEVIKAEKKKAPATRKQGKAS
jgi:chromosome partitioning protein